jgi:hypothetical protein
MWNSRAEADAFLAMWKDMHALREICLHAREKFAEAWACADVRKKRWELCHARIDSFAEIWRKLSNGRERKIFIRGRGGKLRSRLNCMRKPDCGGHGAAAQESLFNY